MSGSPGWVAPALGLASFFCVGLGFWWQRRLGASLALRAAVATLPLVALLLLLRFVAGLLELPFGEWNGARLASSALLEHGYRLYYAPDDGPVLATIYGPVSFLYFWPALALDRITDALLAAGVLNAAAMLLPLGLLHAGALGEGGVARASAWCGVAFAASAVFALSPTDSMIRHVHVDAPAVGLGLAACTVLSGHATSARRVWLSAALGVLAVWTKQIEAPLLVALVVYAFVCHGREAALRVVLAIAVVGFAVSGLFVAIFGFEELRFNLFSIGAGHVANFGTSGAARSALDLLWKSAPLGLLVAALLVVDRDARNVRDGDWLLPAIAGLLLFPVSAVARAKLGAWDNSYHALYYAVAAVSLLVASALRSGGAAGWIAAAALALSALFAVASPGAFAGLERAASLRDNPQERAVAFARAHPGEAYFPWHPLASAYAEGRLHHFDYAVLDRVFAGHPLRPEHVRAFLPDRLRWVAFPDDAQDETMLRYLPAFRARTTHPELPGFTVYTRVPTTR